MRSALLLILTSVLVAGACLLYVEGLVGWAQFLLVLASGAAGAAVMALIDKTD